MAIVWQTSSTKWRRQKFPVLLHKNDITWYFENTKITFWTLFLAWFVSLEGQEPSLCTKIIISTFCCKIWWKMRPKVRLCLQSRMCAMLGAAQCYWTRLHMMARIMKPCIVIVLDILHKEAPWPDTLDLHFTLSKILRFVSLNIQARTIALYLWPT